MTDGLPTIEMQPLPSARIGIGAVVLAYVGSITAGLALLRLNSIEVQRGRR
jgi:hypothetical protein